MTSCFLCNERKAGQDPLSAGMHLSGVGRPRLLHHGESQMGFALLPSVNAYHPLPFNCYEAIDTVVDSLMLSNINLHLPSSLAAAPQLRSVALVCPQVSLSVELLVAPFEPCGFCWSRMFHFAFSSRFRGFCGAVSMPFMVLTHLSGSHCFTFSEVNSRNSDLWISYASYDVSLLARRISDSDL
jgi:hypothetical protein